MTHASSLENDETTLVMKSFWDKCLRAGKVAGREVLEKALWLYYAYRKPGTPVWAKGSIAVALAYFISPLDAVPDFLPLVGYSDDLGVLAAAVVAVSANIDAEVKRLAAEKLKEWGLS